MNRLHPASVLTGLSIAALVAVLVAMKPQSHDRAMLDMAMSGVRIQGTVTVRGIPQARDMVTILPNSVFVVPAESLFVITGVMASTAGNTSIGVSFNGFRVFEGATGSPGTTPTFTFPAGVVALAGTAVASTGTGGAVITGYLEDA